MMHKKIIPFFIFLLAFLLVSFNLPKRIQKKVDKEIKKQFTVESFKLDEITIPDNVQVKLHTKVGKHKLFKIYGNQEKLLGYAYIDKAPSKTDEFDYLILFNEDLIILKTKILVYREDYGGEIGSKRWLKQFIGKQKGEKMKYQKDIIAISGATISAVSMTNAVNDLLKNMVILHENQIF